MAFLLVYKIILKWPDMLQNITKVAHKKPSHEFYTWSPFVWKSWGNIRH